MLQVLWCIMYHIVMNFESRNKAMLSSLQYRFQKNLYLQLPGEFIKEAGLKFQASYVG